MSTNASKGIIDTIMEKALTKVLNVLINALERWLNTDIDGDGDVGK